MYNEQQIQAYLNRLHYNKEITLTREVLDELIYAHQCSIPFEISMSMISEGDLADGGSVI